MLKPAKLGSRILLCGAAILWTFLPSADLPALRLHRSFHRQLWQAAGTATRAGFFLGFLCWIPLMLGLCGYCTTSFGTQTERKTGKGLGRQVAEQLALAACYAIPPPSYYDFGLHCDRKRAQALCYIYRFELKRRGIHGILRKRFSSRESSATLSDKAAFALHCEAQGIAVVTVIAVADKGRLTTLHADGTPLPPIDLFVKPRSGAGGQGAAAWAYIESGSWRSNTGLTLDVDGLAAHLANLSRKAAIVVRPLVTNHHELADLTAGALSTVRITTCLDEGGHPEATNAHFKMAMRREAVVDNYHAGGIVAKVELATGRLDRGMAGGELWSVHPATGAQIVGRKLPLWDDVVQLSLRAHAAFPDCVAVGWDIAILDDGPKLIEGNKSPGLDSVQISLDGPLGSARLGELLMLHLERAAAGPKV